MASKPAAGRGPGQKRKRVVLTLKEKMDICARLEKGESRKALTQEYNVGMSTLYDIRAHKARLLRFFAGSACHQGLERRRTLHTPKLERLDRELHEWFLGRRAEGVPVSGPMLIEKARDLYAQMQLTEPCVFSGGWLWRFKARHGIKKLDVSGEKQVADRQAAEQFCGFFRSLMAEHGLTPEQVYSADETGLFWRCLPGPSPEGGPAPGGRQGRDRLTVLLCANATGSHRIKPLVMGKCGGARAPRGIQHLPVAYRAPGTAWADRAVFSDWFHHIFVPAVREHFRALGLPADSKAILLLDSSRAHPQESELGSENIFTIFLPASVSSLIQPMDQGIRRDFMRNFVSPPVALQGLHPRHSVSDAICSVACAWDAVPRAVFSHAWRRLWPAVALAKGWSSEEEPERLRAKPRDQTFAHVLELGGEAGSRLSGRFPGSTAAGQAGPGQRAGGGRRAEGPPEQAAKTGGAEAAAEGEAAWEQAAVAFDAVLRFAEGQPCFTAQELGQLRALRSVFVRQRHGRWRRPPLRAVVKLEAPQERAGGCAASACSPSSAGEN